MVDQHEDPTTDAGAENGRDLSELSDQALKALSHPLRRRILGLLETMPHARVTTLAEHLDSPVNSVSFHLRSLEKAGLVERTTGASGDRRESHWRLHKLDPALRSPGPSTDAFLDSTQIEQVARLEEVFRQAATYLDEPEGERTLKAELVTRTLLLDEPGFVRLLQDVTRVINGYAQSADEKDNPSTGLMRWDITTFAVRGWDGKRSN